MIYSRDKENPEMIGNLNMVLMGSWKMSTSAESEDFMYKLVDAPLNEELLVDLFCDKPSDRLQSQPLPGNFNHSDRAHILSRFQSSQGLYKGYFKFNGVETTDRFSLIIWKKGAQYHIGGYGENEIGPFTVEGTVTLQGQDKIQERDGMQALKKVKIATF